MSATVKAWHKKAAVAAVAEVCWTIGTKTEDVEEQVKSIIAAHDPGTAAEGDGDEYERHQEELASAVEEAMLAKARLKKAVRLLREVSETAVNFPLLPSTHREIHAFLAQSKEGA